ncbi:MAG: hypothetical protein Q9224_007550, partial [Gallowayella concinna]
MTSKTLDNFVAALMEDYLPDNDPGDLPSEGQIQAIREYLNGGTNAQEAAYACTREDSKPKLREDIGFLIFMTARSLPETQERLVDLVVAILMLPEEKRGDTIWNHNRHLGDFAFEMREYWE